MKNNLHLVPVSVQDIVEKLANKDMRENERMNYVLRLEAIRDYCDVALKKSHNPVKIFTNRKK